MTYVPASTLANTVEDLRRWATQELSRVSTAFLAAQTPTIPVLNAAPAKPVTGQLVIADGTDWDPGSGRGLYYYDSGWVFIA